MDKEKTIRRNTKDSIFRNLFSQPQYLLELHKTLHKEDTDIKEDDLSIITLETVIINDIYNDLGYVVNDKLLILIEAQTTWSPNILLRSFLYLAKTYQNILTEQAANLYGTTKAQIPTPELFVIFTGDKKNKPDTITLQDEFFNGKASCLDLRIKVIYPSESNDIISQYIQFCQIFTQEVKTNSYSKSTIKRIIEKCKSRNILREYLTEKEKEVQNIMEDLFDQEEILKRALNEKVREGRAEGEAKGKLDTLKSLVKEGLISITVAAQKAGLTEEAFKKIACL